MNIEELSKSKEVNERPDRQFHDLLKLSKGEKTPLTSFPIGRRPVAISKNAARLGLFLMNGIDEIRSFSYYGSSHWTYNTDIALNDKRFNYFEKNYNSDKLWDGDNFNLLVFFFGEDIAPLAKAAWDQVPQLYYQRRYYRRSFRAPALKYIVVLNQLNFIIDLIHIYRFALPIEDFIIYNNQLSAWNCNSLLWAVAIDNGNEGVFNLLSDIIYNRHPEGKVSRGIIKAMLLCNRQDAWQAVEQLLLSAQRQEGLRQEILESLDETSVGAMKYMLKVIIDNKLTRFSSVVRAVDVWAGFGWEAEKESTVRRFLELGYKYLSTPELISQGIATDDNAEIYMALWAQAVVDVEMCFPLLEKIYNTANVEKRILVLYFVMQTQLTTLIFKYGRLALDDKNLQVLYWSLFIMADLNFENDDKELFAKILQRREDIPKAGKTYEGKLFSWLTFTISRSMANVLLIKLTREGNIDDIERIIPLFEEMDLSERESLTRKILPTYSKYNFEPSDAKPLNAWERNFAIMAIKDRGEIIRTAAIRALHFAEVDDSELNIFEEMLSRKSADLRKSIINLILNKKDAQIKDSVARLLAAKNADQRLAGLDLLNRLKQDRNEKWVEEQAKIFAEKTKILPQEQILLDNIIGKNSTLGQFSLENGFGLFNPDSVSPIIQPQSPESGIYVDFTRKNAFGLSASTDKVNKAIHSLYDLVIRNKDYEYEAENWNNSMEKTLFGNGFSAIKRDMDEMTEEEQFCNYPLAELWRDWFNESGLTASDLFIINLNSGVEDDLDDDDEKILFPDTRKYLSKIVFVPKIPKIGEYSYQNPIPKILKNLELVNPFTEKIPYLEGFVKTIFSNIHKKDINRVAESKTTWSTYYYTWRNIDLIRNICNPYISLTDSMSDEEFTAYWQLEKWSLATIPVEYPNKDESLSSLNNVCRAYALKLVTYDELVSRVMQKDAIRALTEKIVNKKQIDYIRKYNFLQEIIDKCRDRILEIELNRGDSSTAVTKLSQNLQQIFGIDNFAKILLGLGKDTLHRGYINSWGNQEYNKKEILSTLLKRCFPLKSDIQADFDKVVRQTGLSTQRLIEAAMYAPQWLSFVSNNLNIDGMESATWWLHAHTNGAHTAETETEIGRFSPVDVKDFRDGAVDIDWFNDAYKMVGTDNWQILYDSAKYITDGTGHSRAKLYADVILGNITIDEITKRIDDKRNQDYVRVYGIIPLDAKNADADVLNRYQYLQKFKKDSKQFGSQRQASEALAVKIAMENLARTAGFTDPLRLSWAMETEEAQRIITNTKKLIFDDIEISLIVDKQGKATIECFKNGKELKSIPSKLNKNDDVNELKEYCKVLKEQHSRTRKSLEEAMVNADVFLLNELKTLMLHPVVKPMLESLVLKCNDKIGFYVDGKLQNVKGERFDLDENVFIAHCTDLYQAGTWADYQRYAFENELIQPFRQIFRELYVPTEDELKEVAISRRYAGHQVQPKKTVALLKSRAWTVDYEEGLQKVFHKQGFIAKMYAMADWFSPADVESPTLETVEFIDRKTYKNVPFEKISQRIFSEVMRDIDLVVSVAHVGGVDPEASHSSVEMRAVLVRETARLFKLDNVEVKGSHVHIKGSMGNYSVHLGSAVCHKQPGIYLSILPVHSQHRGRLFLPFVDDDPKSAEVMSKVILLAKDNEIKDPTILRQIVTV